MDLQTKDFAVIKHMFKLDGPRFFCVGCIKIIEIKMYVLRHKHFQRLQLTDVKLEV